MKKMLFILPAALLASVLAAGTAAAGKSVPAASAAAAALRGPLDVPALCREKHASFYHSPLEEGSFDAIFDGNPRTGLRAAPRAGAAAGEAFFQVTLDRPRAVDEVDVVFADAGAAYRWSVAAADTEADMRSHSGSYRVLVPARETDGERWDQGAPAAPRACRVYRLECRRLEPGPVVVGEWS